jgi:hypothetical protein
MLRHTVRARSLPSSCEASHRVKWLPRQELLQESEVARENNIIAKEMEVGAKLYDQKMDAACACALNPNPKPKPYSHPYAAVWATGARSALPYMRCTLESPQSSALLGLARRRHCATDLANRISPPLAQPKPPSQTLALAAAPFDE